MDLSTSKEIIRSMQKNRAVSGTVDIVPHISHRSQEGTLIISDNNHRSSQSSIVTGREKVKLENAEVEIAVLKGELVALREENVAIKSTSEAQVEMVI